jgi:hypothetical protein
LPLCLAQAAKVSIPLLAVALLSMLVPSFFSNFSPILKPFLIAPLCIFPVLSFVVAYVLLIKENAVTWSLSLTVILVFAMLALMIAWYRNRNYKQLLLLDSRDLGIAFCTTNALLVSLQQTESNVIMPALLGSLICTMICVALAATADVWHSIGSGQFWMVCLDGACGMAYFAVPFTLLGWRFWNIYGESVHDTLHYAAMEWMGDLDGMPMSSLELATSSLVLLLGVTSTVGVTMIRSLCPFGAHLYGRIYTCGVEQTKMVAICMDWAEGKALLGDFEKAPVNFVVTCQDLKHDAEALQEAVKAGHTLMPYTGERKAHVEYKDLFGKPPEWAHGETYPNDILACEKNGTKIALWSNYYTDGIDDIDALVEDMANGNGGAIICFENVANVVEVVEQLSAAGYTAASLSEVTKEFDAMSLSAEDALD